MYGTDEAINWLSYNRGCAQYVNFEEGLKGNEGKTFREAAPAIRSSKGKCVELLQKAGDVWWLRVGELDNQRL